MRGAASLNRLARGARSKCKPITRTQFADPKSQNPAENFKLFASLVQWLMVLNGNYTEQWDRFTDPNVTVANMSACPPLPRPVPHSSRHPSCLCSCPAPACPCSRGGRAPVARPGSE